MERLALAALLLALVGVGACHYPRACLPPEPCAPGQRVYEGPSGIDCHETVAVIPVDRAKVFERTDAILVAAGIEYWRLGSLNHDVDVLAAAADRARDVLAVDPVTSQWVVPRE